MKRNNNPQKYHHNMTPHGNPQAVAHAPGQPNFPVAADAEGFVSSSLQKRRDDFCSYALPRVQRFNAITNPSAGDEIVMEIPGSGYGLGLYLDVVAVITSTLQPKVSNRYPHHLITKAEYTDPNSSSPRVRMSGYQSRIRRLANRRPIVSNEDQRLFNVGNPGYPTWATNLFSASKPGAAMANNAAEKVRFGLWIPLVVDFYERDLRGIHSLGSAKKRPTLAITINPSMFNSTGAGLQINDDTLTYDNTNTATTNAVLTNSKITPYLYYAGPTYDKSGASVYPPEEDMDLIFEIMSSRNTALNVGAETPTYMTPGRTYRHIMAEVESNGQMVTGRLPAYSGYLDSANVAGVTDIRTELNGNLSIMPEPLNVYSDRIRNEKYGYDLPLGVFDWDMRDREFDADEYTQLSVILALDAAFATTGTVVLPSYIQTLRECLYEGDITQEVAA